MEINLKTVLISMERDSIEKILNGQKTQLRIPFNFKIPKRFYIDQSTLLTDNYIIRDSDSLDIYEIFTNPRSGGINFDLITTRMISYLYIERLWTTSSHEISLMGYSSQEELKTKWNEIFPEFQYSTNPWTLVINI